MKNILAFLTAYKAKKAQHETLTDELKQMQKELDEYTKANYVPDANGKYKFTCGQYVVTLSPIERVDIDKTRLASDHPEIMDEYKKVTTYDRMNVK